MTQSEMAWLAIGAGAGLLATLLIASPTMRLIAGIAVLVAGIVALMSLTKTATPEVSA